MAARTIAGRLALSIGLQEQIMAPPQRNEPVCNGLPALLQIGALTNCGAPPIAFRSPLGSSQIGSMDK